MSSPSYYNEYDSDIEEYGEIENETYEEYEPYMNYDEEMAAFEDSNNYLLEDDADGPYASYYCDYDS